MDVECELGKLCVGRTRLVAVPCGALPALEPGHDLEPTAGLDRLEPTAVDLGVLDGERRNRVGTLPLSPLDERLGARGDGGIEDAGSGVRRVHRGAAAIERADPKLAFGELLCEITSCVSLRVIAKLPHGLETKSEGPHPDR